MLACLYAVTVTDDAHKWALENSTGEESNLFLAEYFESSPIPKSLSPKSDINCHFRALGSIERRKQIINSLFNHSIQGLFDDKNSASMFSTALECFMQLILNPDMVVDENNYIDLEDVGIVYVKYRHPVVFSRITPRVSLPFLYSYSTQPSSKISQQFTAHAYLLRLVCEALQGVNCDLPESFEDVMLPVELLRIFALKQSEVEKQHFPIERIFPGAVIVPWVTAATVVSRNYQDILSTTCEKYLEGPCCGGRENAKRLIELAKSTNVIWYKQTKSCQTECIESVSCHLSTLSEGASEKLLFLNSMKLRTPKSVNPRVIAQEIHSLAAEAGLKSGQYYAALYCCNSFSTIDTHTLPPGTIIITSECLKALLHPFGASFLMNSVCSKETSFSG
jgi:hypothetical protein